MRAFKKTYELTTLATIIVVLFSTGYSQTMPTEYQDVLTLLGKKGDYKDNVFKLNIPRSDLKVTVAGIATPTPFGFGGWLAMTKGDQDVDVMMGDLVLLQDEVNPIMSALLEHGLEVTALHNHFFWDQPKLFYMHVHGHGKPMELAQKVKPALDLIGKVGGETVSETGEKAAGQVLEGKLDTGKLNSIVGHDGEQIGPVLKFTVGRSDIVVKDMGAVINTRMGLNTWAAFIGSDEKAAVAGDIAMLESEVTPVLKALRKNDLKVVAIHHHMMSDRPMIIFLHYWGVGPAEKLATGFKEALDQIGTKKETKSMDH